MRWILAGLFILLVAGSGFAQSKGEVESIGFGGYYRPDCWTPMVVRIRPGTLEPGYYQIQIEQKDQDIDTQVFTRIIQVNAAEAAREQRFAMYFLPQTIKKGLPDSGAGASIRDLSGDLKVWLCNKDGKQIEPLPLTSTVRSVDQGLTAAQRPIGRKMILCVTDGSDKVRFEEYAFSFGITEDILPIILRANELPESVLGYDGVDAVLWMSGDSDELSKAGATRLPALTQFVKMGGKLIVTQPADRGKIEALEPLLPIELKDAGGNWLIEMKERSTLRPLREWIKPMPRLPINNQWLQQRDPISGKLNPFGPFKVARATVTKPGAMVVESIDWNATDGPAAETKDLTPYLVRWGVGLGQVTWVAQNLGDLSITRGIDTGWVGVWDKVLDLKNDPAPVPGMNVTRLSIDQVKAREEYANGGSVDLGYATKDAVEHIARGAGLVVLAIGFFIVYWAAAGPISYFVLANKKKKGANWPIFAACALVATLLTVGVVKLVMGSSADIHHVTFVRWAPNTPAVVESRFGVYLTKSSTVGVSLLDADPDSSSYVSAYNEHPGLYDSGDGFVGKQRYEVWVFKDKDEQSPTVLNVPFRSTLKKLQARWVGQMPGIDGKPTLTEGTEDSPLAVLSGRLTNSTGRGLRNVYLAYVEPQPNGTRLDRLIYLPAWPKGVTIDLTKDLASATYVHTGGEMPKAARPGDNKIISDTIPLREDNWVKFWSDGLRPNAADGRGMSSTYDHEYLRSFPLISLYERLPVIKRTATSGERFDLKRLGVRKFDMSQCVAAGELVILAHDVANDENGKTNSTLPYPLEVDGDKIPGSGVTFYQFALPLTRVTPPPPAPATLPTTAPATTPALEK